MVYIPGQTRPELWDEDLGILTQEEHDYINHGYEYEGEEVLLHIGRKWSEEAKRRVSEARKAGRSVYEMFGSYYNNLKDKAGNSVNKVANDIANKTIYKKEKERSLKRYVTAANAHEKAKSRMRYTKGAVYNTTLGNVNPNYAGTAKNAYNQAKRNVDRTAKTKKDAAANYYKRKSTKRILKDAGTAASKLISKWAKKARIRQSGLDSIYIPGRIGASEVSTKKKY